jgi:hypothetical protein
VADVEDLTAYTLVKLRVSVPFEGEKLKHNVYRIKGHEVEESRGGEV